MKHVDFMVADVLSLVVSFLLAYSYKFGNFSCLSSYSWRVLILFSSLVEIILIFLFSPFSGISRRKEDKEFLVSFEMALVGVVVVCIYLYVMKVGAVYSRFVIILTYILHFFLSTIFRSVWKAILRSGLIKTPINTQKSLLVIGRKEDIPSILHNTASDFFREYEIKAICVSDGKKGDTYHGVYRHIMENGVYENEPVDFHSDVDLSDIAEYVLSSNIDEVFVGIRPGEVDSSIYKTLVDNGKGIHMSIEAMLGFSVDDQFITTVGVTKALGVGVYSFSTNQLIYLVLKRFFDIIIGLVGLVCIFPLMVVVKLCYLLSGDTKSIFYTQERIGVNGKPFHMLKFRSMVHNADDILKELLKDPAYRKEWEENQKFEKDPRITRVGRLLRKTSLDEVPQVLNILKGDMSLVGPRPLVKGELEAHDGLKLYTMVKPGLTGWWGCNGRSNTTYEERLELEYYYVKNCSLYLDALCVLKTAASVLKREGAK